MERHPLGREVLCGQESTGEDHLGMEGGGKQGRYGLLLTPVRSLLLSTHKNYGPNG